MAFGIFGLIMLKVYISENVCQYMACDALINFLSTVAAEIIDDNG